MGLLQRWFRSSAAAPEDNTSYGGGYLPLKQLNAKLVALQLLTQDDSIETMPQWVGLAATTFCNLRCPHCQTHGTEEKRRQYNQKRWSAEMLRRVAAECLPTAYHFNLTLNGEPLATPRLRQHLEELSQYGARLHLNTNGTLFTKQTLIRLLPLVGEVCVSVDGATKLTSEKLRLGADFGQLLTNIRLLTRSCELLPPALRPDIHLSFVLMASNLREMPQMVRMAHALKVPTVNFNLIIVFYPHLEDEDVRRHPALYNACYLQAQDEARRLNVRIDNLWPLFPGVQADPGAPVGGPRTVIQQWPEDYCPTVPSYESFLDHARIEAEAAEIARSVRLRSEQLAATLQSIQLDEVRRLRDVLRERLRHHRSQLKRLAAAGSHQVRFCENLCHRTFINIDGLVAPCCIPTRPNLGNVCQNGLREIWNGREYRDFRRRFQSEDMPECCRDCRFVVSRPVEKFLAKLQPELTAP